MLTIDVQAVLLQAVVPQSGDAICHGAELMINLFSVKRGKTGIVVVAADSVYACVIPVSPRPK